MRFLIYNADGNRVNTIVATESFVANYCEVNGYTYEKQEEPVVPGPAPEPAAPTAQEDTDALLVDHEYRLTLLELGLTE